jgi:amino acid transporter
MNTPGSNKQRTGPPLARKLGLPGTIALGLGAMIGAGVFVLSGMAAGIAGPALILVFVLNGLIALVVGACYAELAAMIPRTGGAYVWAKLGLSPFVGYFAGWMSWFAQAIACSLYATAFGSFAVTLVQITTGNRLDGRLEMAFSIAVLLAFLQVNYRGAGGTAIVEIVVTSVKIMVLLVIVGFGLGVMSSHPSPLASFTPFLPEGVSGVWIAMGLTFIAFEGYEIIVQTAEEVEQPARTIPRAILASIAIAVSVYVLIAVVLLGAVTPPAGQSTHLFLGELGELGLMEAAGQFVPGGRIILLIAGLASTASALNATIYGSTRIAFAMGRNGDLPALLGRVHRVHRTPHLSIITTGGIMILVTLLLPIRDIAAATDVMFLLVFIIVCATVIRLRSLQPERERPFRVPLSPWLPAIGIAAGFGLLIGLVKLSVAAWITAGTWLMLGLLSAIFVRRRVRED